MAPVPVRDLDYDQICIATIYVAAGATSITTSAITDTRLDESICGIMSDGVTRIPTQALYAQFMSTLGDIIAAAHDALSGDVAGNLLNLINARVTIESIVNALTSDDAAVPLSAAQGKVLKTLLDSKVSIESIVNSLTSNAINVPLSAAQGKALKTLVDNNQFVVLWENESPNSNFLAQTIALDLSAYRFIVVDYAAYKGAIRVTGSSARAAVGENMTLFACTTTNRTRAITTSAAGLVIADCNRITTYGVADTTVDNAACIPMRVIGYK